MVLALLGVATACRGDGTPATRAAQRARALTAAEAEALAVVRFGNYRAGSVRGSISAPGPEPLDAEVLIDFRRHLGFAVDRGSARPAQLAWDGDRVWVSVDAVRDPFHGEAPAAARWRSAPLNATNPVDLFLALVLKLGSDRPENPQLLQQSTARYLRAASVDGHRVRVFSGPREAGASGSGSRTTYWVDRAGRLVRFEAVLGTGAPFVLELDPDERDVRMSDVVEQLSRHARGGRG